MLTIIRDRVKDAVDNGRSLRALMQSRPALDYEGVFGASTGPWTTEMFVEAAYRSLNGEQ